MATKEQRARKVVFVGAGACIFIGVTSLYLYAAADGNLLFGLLTFAATVFVSLRIGKAAAIEMEKIRNESD